MAYGKPILFLSAFIGFCISITYGGYVVVFPRHWTYGERTQICLSLTDNAVIGADDFIGFSFDPRSRDPAIKKAIVVLHLTAGKNYDCVSFDVPKSDRHLAEVELEGKLSGNSFMEAFNVSISQSRDKTFIQTDKYLYQKGQTVQFRMLQLSGPLLKVSIESFPEVYVENPSRRRIEQWLDVANPKGLIHLHFKLPEEPEEGSYNIYAIDSKGNKHQAYFKVEEYVLPRFEVTIKPTKTILGSDKEVALKVCAKYTFGQPVRGKVSLSVAIGSYRTYANITQEKKITGCQVFLYNTTALRFDDNNCHIRINNLKADAKVVEEGTNTELFGSNYRIPVHRRVISFSEVSPNYVRKAFLPVQTSIKSKYNDGSPAANELMDVCTYWNGENVCKNMTTNKNGILSFLYPNSVSGTIEVTAVNYPRIERNFNDVMEESKFFKYQYYGEKFTHAHNASISIYTNDELKCEPGQMVTFSIPLIYIIEDKPENAAADVYIQVISRGQIQYSDRQTVQFTKTQTPFDKLSHFLEEQNYPAEIIIGRYDFSAQLPNSVSPKVKVVAWFAKSDGAVIADAAELDVTSCLNHDVKMVWPVSKLKPGETANLEFSGAPGAICSYGVVDKSVELLSNPDDSITVDKILQFTSNSESRRWDGRDNLDLEFCLKKYNRTLDLPKIEGVAEEGMIPDPVPVRIRRSFLPPSRGREIEATEIFKKTGMFVFSDQDLESQYCERKIEAALKEKFSRPRPSASDGQINNKIYTDNRIVNRRPVAAASPPQNLEVVGVAQHDFAGNAGSFESVTVEESTRERAYFPETWLWDLVDLSTETGKATQTLTVPDTITEWVGKAVCLHPEKGIGLSKRTSLITFTSFFVDLTLPSSIKRGEILPLKISIFNYLEYDLPVKVTLQSSSDYEFIPVGEKGIRTLCLKPNGQMTEIIKLKPTIIGDVNITVEASVTPTGNCGPKEPKLKSDLITRSLAVEAEGFVREKVWSNYVCLEDLQNDSIDPMEIEGPEGIVPDSQRGWITVVGDLVALTNLHNLLSLPYGCGEQNMIRFAPNIYILTYLKAAKEGKDLQEEALRLMKIGYQRQQTFFRRSGASSTFGDLDRNGSTWLTAFVAKSFCRAKPYMYIDDKLIENSIKWLKARQGEDGCFESRGKIVNKRMLGGLNGRSSLLTAYVLISLIDCGEPVTSGIITQAVSCVLADNSTHPYDQALKAYALSIAGAEEATSAVENLVAVAASNISDMRWPIPEGNNRAIEIETAAYGLLAMLENNPTNYKSDARKIVRYITSNRNSLGGFVSTQDTVVALQALAQFEKLKTSRNLDLSITAQMGADTQTFNVTKANRLLEQRAVLLAIPTVVDLSMTGAGCAVVQGVLRYNILTEDPANAFTLRKSIETLSDDHCAARNISICSSYTLPDEKSNMAVIEASLPSGYSPRKSDLKKSVQDSVKRYEVDGGKVRFYIDEINSEEVCVSFRIYRDVVIDNLQDRYIKVYDYYQDEYSKEMVYNVVLSPNCK